MSKSVCKGRCSNDRKSAYYWQGFKRCNQCERFINTKNDTCHCCSGVLVFKPKSKQVRILYLYSSCVQFAESKTVAMKQVLREALDEHDFFKKVTLINNELNTDPELVFILINYFAGKKYRLGRPIGQGNEQITFIKDK